MDNLVIFKYEKNHKYHRIGRIKMAVQKTGAAGQKTEYVLVPKTELEALRRRAADVEILQRKVDVLQELALKDPLTRAGNRRARDERLSIEKS